MKAAVKAGYLGSDCLWRAKPVRQVLSDSPSSYAAKGTSSASTRPSRQKARIRSPSLQKKATELTRHSSTTRHDTQLLHASSRSERNASLLFVYENCLYKQRKCYCEFSARKLVSERSERQTNRLLRTDSFTCRSWWNCISKMFVIGRNAR